MYLKKKMLLLPLAGQYEQIINANYVEKLALGISAEKLDTLAVKRFLKQLDTPVPNDEKILWPDNQGFFEILQQALNKLKTPIDISIS